jgi:sugar lactone lactonase YvrE
VIEAGRLTGAPRLLWPAGAELGEGSLWDDRTQSLYWLDIEGRRLHRNDAQGGARRSWDLPTRVGCAALT